jgi:cytochrome c556
MRTKSVLVLLTAAMLLAGVSQAQDSASSVLNLMKSIVIPQSDIIFAVGKAAPRSDQEWAAVQQSAGRLTEAAKTLSAQAPATNGANWLKFSQSMGDAVNRASAAANAKNVDAVLDAGDVLYESCEGCHKQYMKK